MMDGMTNIFVNLMNWHGSCSSNLLQAPPPPPEQMRVKSCQSFAFTPLFSPPSDFKDECSRKSQLIGSPRRSFIWHHAVTSIPFSPPIRLNLNRSPSSRLNAALTWTPNWLISRCLYQESVWTHMLAFIFRMVFYVQTSIQSGNPLHWMLLYIYQSI